MDSVEATRSFTFVLITIGTFVAVCILWALTPIAMSLVYPGMAERGQAGDLFGSINALFSGLAFAGVIIAILLQREELRLQREELAATRTELARTASAQEDSREALRRTIYTHAFKTAHDVLQSETVRSARRTVFSYCANPPFEQWPEAAINAGEVTCNSYDIVGIMVRHDMLPSEYIVDSWGDSLRRTWPILKPLVEHQRKMRSANEFWDDYEFLARAAFDFQNRQR